MSQSRLYPLEDVALPGEVLETIDRAGEFGIDTTVDDVAFADIVREVNEEVHEDAESTRRGLESSSDHDLYRSVRDEAAVWDYCASAFDADDAIEDAGLVRIDENEGHPSIRSLVDDDYEITF
ncbi:hypothetical protein [Halopiger goleimassiliensis]|uniref:hypothetical protein n=1 Tax=Halopiger goleimassiliensis TaxID=1293048 RepID=UPI000A95B942|nr:hypothetical protein [Halopiger goleimassiliensis]